MADPRQTAPLRPMALSALLVLITSGAGCWRTDTPVRDLDEPPPGRPSAAPGSPATPAGSPSAVATPAPSASPNPAPPTYADGFQSPGGGPGAVRGEHGVVTSVEDQATRAGIEILEAGGNAVDAAVAVGYALAVTHPSAGNVGGGGLMLVRPPGGPTEAIDFREVAPARLTRKRFLAMMDAGALGPAAAGVPGTVAGLNLAHQRHGKLPLSRVLAPAIRLAGGHRVSQRAALTYHWNWRYLRKDPGSRAVFGARPPRPGARLRRPGLKATLRRIARDGNAGFYRGPVARAIVAAMGQRGLLTLTDLRNYQAKVREPLALEYRGFLVEAAPPPSAGGVAVVQSLLMHRVLESWKATPTSADAAHLTIEVSRRVHGIRRYTVADPDHLSPAERSARRRLWADPTRAFRYGPPVDRRHATPSSAVNPVKVTAHESEETTHYSVVDREGRVVSVTTTLSAGFGSKVLVPGAGVILNNSVPAFSLAGDSQPGGGRRMTTSMCPTLVSRSASALTPLLVLGSPGGNTIPDTVVQVLRNVVDHRMPLDAAVKAPRFHHRLDPDEFRYERRRPPAANVLKELATLGHRASKKRIPIGDANVILIDDDGAWAMADPREGGLALAVPTP